jgi:hypothetical protein
MGQLVPKNLFQGNLILKGAVALAAFGLTYYVLKGQSAATAFDTTTIPTTVASTMTVEEFKNKILDKIYRGAMNPTVLIQNIEAVKAEVNSYTTQITTLISERTAGRIPESTLEYYCKAIAEEIAKKLNIELRPQGWGGGYGGYDGGGGYGWPPYGGGGSGQGQGQGHHYGWRNKHKKPWKGGYGDYYGGGMDDYGDMYQQYLDQIMQYYQQLMGGGYYQPNYGYSTGYGYQQPNMQAYYPTQNYNYYPQYPGSYNQPNQALGYIPPQPYGSMGGGYGGMPYY